MKRALAIGAGVLVLGLAVGAIWFWRQRSRVDLAVSQPYVEKDLTTDEIRSKLGSGEFKQVQEATKQIDKLEPEERLRVLLKLAEDPQSPIRLRAVKKLRALDDPRAKTKLEKMAREDSDADVRELAGTPK